MTTQAFQVQTDVDLDAAAAFEQLAGDLATALADRGLQLEAGPGGGILQGAAQAGAVRNRWRPGCGSTMKRRWLRPHGPVSFPTCGASGARCTSMRGRPAYPASPCRRSRGPVPGF